MRPSARACVCVSVCVIGFLMCLYTFFVFAAVFRCFVLFLYFCWSAHGFLDAFAPLDHFAAMFMSCLILFCFY